jgi:hypothetical protein
LEVYFRAKKAYIKYELWIDFRKSGRITSPKTDEIKHRHNSKAAFLPLHLKKCLTCRYKPNMNHVTRDHVSIGSHAQYLPHVLLAHIAPEITVRLQNINPKAPNL